MTLSTVQSLLLVAALVLLSSAHTADGARAHAASRVSGGQQLKVPAHGQDVGLVKDIDATATSERCGGQADEICSLPGLNGAPHVRMRSGYITVSEVSDRQLWYLVAEREEDDSRVSDESERVPVVLWLTGGPGCSSLDAFIYEHGPFSFSYGGTDNRDVVLGPNPYSWTKVATVIYVDSPAGAGMSYSGRPDVDYHTNDEYTIADLMTFLQGLTERYPELATAPFFIAGESYSGVFVPMLATELVRFNKERRAARKEPLVDLQGYVLGNPVTDDVIDGNAQLRFAADMGYIDPPTWRRIRSACDDMFWNATPGSDCWDAQGVVKDDLWDLNWYDVLEACVRDETASSPAHRSFGAFTARGTDPREESGEPADLEAGRRGGRKLWGPWLRHVVPCMDRRLALDWLNRDEVRSALHASPASVIGGWQPCSDVLYYRLDTASLMPLHEALVEDGIRALVYTGDHDMVVPHTGTREWLYDRTRLGAVDGPLRPWMMDGQISGFTARFAGGAGLRFATVKGAGHMVPQSKPAQALHLLDTFLHDQDL